MLVETLVRSGLGRFVVRRAGYARTADIIGDLLPVVPAGARVLDVGAGTCDVAAALTVRGRDVVALDVRDTSCVPGLRPQLYDGKRLPFEDASFDWALLIDVLHHTDPDRLLAEAGRVARNVFVHEDVYSTERQRQLTRVMDAVLNLEFVGHPHANRDDAGWRATFARLGFVLEEASSRDFWRYFSCATYVLRSPSR
jgi:SAM-dependent methyltransferase